MIFGALTFLVEFVTDFAYTRDQLSTLSSSIFINCSSNHNVNQTSLLYIHPFQFPGVAVTMTFKCDDPPCNYCDEISCYNFDCSLIGYSGACPNYTNACNNYYLPWSCTASSACAEGREGILCGNCSEGYAIAINDPDLSCTQCNSPYYGVAIFLFLQIVPVLIMLTLLAVLHIKITDGHFSGFVLLSQMVTLQFPGQASVFILGVYKML